MLSSREVGRAGSEAPAGEREMLMSGEGGRAGRLSGAVVGSGREGQDAAAERQRPQERGGRGEGVERRPLLEKEAEAAKKAVVVVTR